MVIQIVAFVIDMVDRWQLHQEQGALKVKVEVVEDAGIAGDERKGQDGEHNQANIDCHWLMISDAIRIEQIIVNLLNNGRDAMSTSGVMTIRLFGEGSGFLIQVRDTGLGIPAAEQEYVFEAFYRGQNKERRVSGLGLGLPFSKLIARSLGGDLILSHSDASGTTMSLKLPRLIEVTEA